MRDYYVGRIIKQRRQELGISQEKLCEGLCDQTTMSRIENGKQEPGRRIVSVLLQRLDLPEDKFVMLSSKRDLDIINLQYEILSCNVHDRKEEGLNKISKLEMLLTDNDVVSKQFVLRSKVLLGKKEEKKIIPYVLEEKLKILNQAIELTVPKFDANHIETGLYGIDEMKTINQIALVYYNMGQKKKAFDMYNQMLRYIDSNFKETQRASKLIPLITYNYARILCLEKQFSEAYNIAKRGKEACVRYGQYRYLPGMLALSAESLHYLNNDALSEEYYMQAYYIYKATGDKVNSEVIKNDALELLNLKLN